MPVATSAAVNKYCTDCSDFCFCCTAKWISCVSKWRNQPTRGSLLTECIRFKGTSIIETAAAGTSSTTCLLVNYSSAALEGGCEIQIIIIQGISLTRPPTVSLPYNLAKLRGKGASYRVRRNYLQIFPRSIFIVCILWAALVPWEIFPISPPPAAAGSFLSRWVVISVDKFPSKLLSPSSLVVKKGTPFNTPI